MKKGLKIGLAFGTLLMLVALIFGNNASACWTDDSPLYAGQNTVIGEVGVGNYENGDTLYLRYLITEEGWELIQVHVAVAEDFDDIPQTKKGSPKVGQFPYKAKAGEITDECWYSTATEMRFHIPMDPEWQSGDTLYIAAHAVVIGPGCQEETAWADTGLEFGGGSWALYFIYTVT